MIEGVQPGDALLNSRLRWARETITLTPEEAAWFREERGIRAKYAAGYTEEGRQSDIAWFNRVRGNL